MNVVTLIGRLTRDPDPLRQTGGGTPTTTFRLAVSRPKKDGADEPAVYVDVVTYGALAESTAAHLTTGREVGVTGRLDHREWETDEGGQRSKHAIVASQGDWLRPGKSEAAAGALGDEERF